MKKFISFIIIIAIFTSCTKEQILEPVAETQEVLDVSTRIPVNFDFSAPACERPEIIFKGETYLDSVIISGDSTVNLRDDQKYTVSFKLNAERCSPGAIILGDEKGEELNLWLGSYPARAEKQHVDLESKFFIYVNGE